MRLKALINSFANALAGLLYAITTQRNMVIQLIIGIVTIAMGVRFRLSEVEWLFIISAIFRVIGHETLNTSVEILSDVCENRRDIDIKHVKDMSAAYVLLSALYSVIVGVVVFVPKIVASLGG